MDSHLTPLTYIYENIHGCLRHPRTLGTTTCLLAINSDPTVFQFLLSSDVISVVLI